MFDVGSKFVFQNKEIVLFDGENNPWFKGLEDENILGHICTNKAVINHVDI